MATQVCEEDEDEIDASLEYSSTPPPPPPAVWGKLLPLLPGLGLYTLRNDVIRVGRSSTADVSIKDQKISSTHCEITRVKSSGDVFITDRSVNGTWVNEAKLKKNVAQLLSHSDEVVFAVGPLSKVAPVANFLFQQPMEPGSASAALNPISTKYALDAVIGRGACGYVRRARERATGKLVAIKVIDKKRTGGERERQSEMIRREATLLQKCNHPNITRCFEVIDTELSVYIVMEFVGGGELLTKLQRDGAFSESDAKVIAHKILDAVNYLHNTLVRPVSVAAFWGSTLRRTPAGDSVLSRCFRLSHRRRCCPPAHLEPPPPRHQGIVHRDLKPENILFADPADSTSIKITDFGLAKVRASRLHGYVPLLVLHYISCESFSQPPLTHSPSQCHLWFIPTRNSTVWTSPPSPQAGGR